MAKTTQVSKESFVRAYQLCKNDNQTMDALAAMLGVSTATAYNYCSRFNIDTLRKPGMSDLTLRAFNEFHGKAKRTEVAKKLGMSVGLFNYHLIRSIKFIWQKDSTHPAAKLPKPFTPQLVKVVHELLKNPKLDMKDVGFLTTTTGLPDTQVITYMEQVINVRR